MTGTIKTAPLTEAAAGALAQRGIDVEIADRYGVETIVKRRGTDDREWIAIPHLRNGKQVHAAYRTVTGKKDFWQQKGGERGFWNEGVLSDRTLYSQPLIITEGHLDALACISAGHIATMSICDGAPAQQTENPRQKYDYVVNALPLIDEFKTVVLAVDGDEKGTYLLHDLARIIGRAKCKWVSYGEGCKDACDVAGKYGTEALTAVLNAARYMELPGLYGFDDLPKCPVYRAVSCGKAGLEDLWRFRAGELSVLCGIPSHGKTTLINDVACGLAIQHGWVTAFFSPEQPARIQIERLIHRKLGKAPHSASDQEAAAARQWVADHFVWIQAGTDVDPTVDWMIEMMEGAAVRHNARMVVIDPWNELDHTWRPEGVSATEYVGEMLKRIKRALQHYALHGVIGAHPNKGFIMRGGKSKDGELPPPTGYDIADSAHFVNKADLGLTIHRRKEDVMLWNWKTRYHGEHGKQGEISMRWSPYHGRFEYMPTEPDEIL